MIVGSIYRDFVEHGVSIIRCPDRKDTVDATREQLRAEAKADRFHIRTAYIRQTEFFEDLPVTVVYVVGARIDYDIEPQVRKDTFERTGIHLCRQEDAQAFEIVFPQGGWRFCPMCGDKLDRPYE